MEAREKSLDFITKEKKITVPFFQRPYVWTKDNWIDLLADLQKKDKNHFLGSIIIKQKKRTGEVNEAFIIDGQQRLTTLSILIKAIYDCFDDKLKNTTKDKMRNCLFYKIEDTDEDWHIKIEHSRVDSQSYKKVIEGEPDETDKSKIAECYRFFIGELKYENTDDLKSLFNRILNQDNKMLVVIDISENEDEQAIFDTINTAGVKLTSADTIKNYIFQKGFSIYRQNHARVIKLYEDYWENVFADDEEDVEYWSKQRLTGRLTRDNIEILLHCFATIKCIYEPSNNTLSNLAQTYKKYIDTLDIASFEPFLKELSEYARLYREKFIECKEGMAFNTNDSVNRLFHTLHSLEITTFHAYILKLFYIYNKDEKSLKEKLLDLEKFVIYNALINSGNKKNYNNLCVDFIVGSKTPVSERPKTDKTLIEQGLQGIGNKLAAFYLFWIELQRRRSDQNIDRQTLNYNYSLEHIMPQRWKEHWKNVAVYDYQGVLIEDPETAEEIRYKAVYSLGNMTLLKCYLNNSLKNYNFERKILGEGKRKGIKEYAELYITKNDILIPFNNGDKLWDERKINNRTNKLIDEIVECWQL